MNAVPNIIEPNHLRDLHEHFARVLLVNSKGVIEHQEDMILDAEGIGVIDRLNSHQDFESDCVKGYYCAYGHDGTLLYPKIH